MPCGDGGVPYPKTREEILDAKVPTPMLCALLSAIPKFMSPKDQRYLFEKIDWKEAGITRAEFQEWWKNHKRRDAERIESENAAKVMARLRKSAIDKLTPAELKALGVKK